MNTNSENPKVGKEFEKFACKTLEKYFGCPFEIGVKLPIGNPPKLHEFDCASDDRRIVAECKCYTWTDTGNVPSAKLMGMNEAVFYMSYLPSDTKKVLVLKKAVHARKNETLAEYYYRINNHLLEQITLIEIDEFGSARKVK